MTTNLSPDYKKAEKAFRDARDEQMRLSCLKEMLRTIPKHKGTEHLQADIKSRIKQPRENIARPKNGGKRSNGPAHSIRPDGAAQVALIGPPNAGKSSLHVALTGSRAVVGPYPHTTHELMPGMLPFEDVRFQIIDSPPVTADYMDSWFANALQLTDAVMLVVDISDPQCADYLAIVCERFDEKKVTLSHAWPGINGRKTERADDDEKALDPFRIYLPTLLVVNKIDLNGDPKDVAALIELTGVSFPALWTSAQSRENLENIGATLFKALDIVRVYTKMPGKSAQMGRPFTVRSGATVLDVARLVHKDIAGSFKYARAWGARVFDGQQVGPEHQVVDRDIVELHIR